MVTELQLGADNCWLEVSPFYNSVCAVTYYTVIMRLVQLIVVSKLHSHIPSYSSVKPPGKLRRVRNRKQKLIVCGPEDSLRYTGKCQKDTIHSRCKALYHSLCGIVQAIVKATTAVLGSRVWSSGPRDVIGHVTIDSPYGISCWWSFGTKSLSLTVSEIFNSKCDAMVDMTLIRPLNKGQGHSFWYQLISRMRLPMLSIINFALGRTV